MNTPKCGTGGIETHFSKTSTCLVRTTQMPTVFQAECRDPSSVSILKSHNHENHLLYTQRLLNIYATGSKPKKCLLITAVRDPATWLLSKFMQDRGQRMGYYDSTSITPREALDDYKSWISKSAALNRHRAQ
jgi:hypothetical protein